MTTVALIRALHFASPVLFKVDPAMGFTPLREKRMQLQQDEEKTPTCEKSIQQVEQGEPLSFTSFEPRWPSSFAPSPICLICLATREKKRQHIALFRTYSAACVLAIQ